MLVSALLKQYFYIAFLMRKPQDLPAGEAQLTIGIALNLITYTVALIALYGTEAAILHAAVDIGLSGVLFYSALKLTSKLERFEQGFGGLCGANAVLNVGALLMLYPVVSANTGQGGFSTDLAYYLLMVWGISLSGHIIRHTFNINMVASIGAALVYFLLINTLLLTLWPHEEQAETGANNVWVVPSAATISSPAAA